MQKENYNTILDNFSLKNYNTFGFNIYAKHFFAFDTIDSLSEIFDNKKYIELPKFVLGGGSNILFTKDYNGIIIHPLMKGISIVDENEECVILKALSGENWDDFVAYAVSQNFGGVENLSGIPGNIGASPIQNIGAYGSEVKDTIFEVEALDIQSKKIVLIKNSDCRFGYRDSLFKNEGKGKFIILSVTFKFTKKYSYNTCYGEIEKELELIGDLSLINIRKAVLNIRAKKLPDPQIIGNAGSFFKNPVISNEVAESVKKMYPDVTLYKLSEISYKIPAGWLIEKCGWKGKRIGNVGVHDKQALVLVNFGMGTGEEVVAISEKIIHSVQEKFNITISPEVNVL